MIKELIEYFGDNLQEIGAIGTLLMAFITGFTLLTLRKQVNNSLRPILSFINNVYAVSSGKKDSLKTIWYKDGDEVPKYSNLGFEIYNVGVGMATEVVLKEYYNYKRLMKYIKKYDKDNVVKIKKYKWGMNSKAFRKHNWLEQLFSYRYTEYVVDILEGDSIKMMLFFDRNSNMSTRELGNIFTADFYANKPLKYLFDNLTTACFTILKYLIDTQDATLLFDYPPTKYKLIYKDADGKKYKNRFIMTLIPYGATFSLRFTQYSKKRWIWYRLKDFVNNILN